jgi:hypothetical protein
MDVPALSPEARKAVEDGCTPKWHDGIHGWAWHCKCPDNKHGMDQQCSVVSKRLRPVTRNEDGTVTLSAEAFTTLCEEWCGEHEVGEQGEEAVSRVIERFGWGDP